MVTKTLLESKPRGWVGHLTKFLGRDALPPDMMSEEQHNRVRYVGIKILNYVSNPGIIIMPGQEITISNEFEEDKVLRKAYRRLKAVKMVLEVPVPSYTLKKVLNVVVNHKRRAGTSHMDDKDLLKSSLNHPELKRFFDAKIDFEAWIKPLNLFIPLKK